MFTFIQKQVNPLQYHFHHCFVEAEGAAVVVAFKIAIIDSDNAFYTPLNKLYLNTLMHMHAYRHTKSNECEQNEQNKD